MNFREMPMYFSTENKIDLNTIFYIILKRHSEGRVKGKHIIN